MQSSSEGLLSSTSLIWTLRPDATTLSMLFTADTTPTAVNDSIVSKNISVDLEHSWTQSFLSSAQCSYGITDFTSTLTGSEPRRDHTFGFGLGLNYIFSEYLTTRFLSNHTWTNTNSGSGYERTTAEFNLDIKF